MFPLGDVIDDVIDDDDEDENAVAKYNDDDFCDDSKFCVCSSGFDRIS